MHRNEINFCIFCILQLYQIHWWAPVVFGWYLYYIEVCFLSAHILKGFYHTCILNFVRSFFCIYWDGHMAFILQFVNVVYFIDWFADTEKSLHPWDRSPLVIVYDPFNVFLHLFKLKFLCVCCWHIEIKLIDLCILILLPAVLLTCVI